MVKRWRQRSVTSTRLISTSAPRPLPKSPVKTDAGQFGADRHLILGVALARCIAQEAEPSSVLEPVPDLDPRTPALLVDLVAQRVAEEGGGDVATNRPGTR